MQQTSAAPAPRHADLGDERPPLATLVLVLAAIAAVGGPAVVGVVALHAMTPPSWRGAPSTAPADHAPASSGPLEFAAVLTVDASANVPVRYSTTWEHSVARCTNTTTGVGVYIVNPTATDTAAGGGPWCDTCAAGAVLPAIGRGYLRTAAGTATVTCTFNDGWGASAAFPPSSGGGGGLSISTADGRYVNVTGDTMTGALTMPAGTACTAPAVRIGDADTGFARTVVGTAPGSAIELCVDGTRAGLVSIGSTPATCSYGNWIGGWGSGLALDLSGDCSGDDAIHNTAAGAESLVSLVDGMQNTCIGNRTCHDMVSASQSTCIGQGACYERSGGTDTAVGFHTLVNVDSTYANTCGGYRSCEGTNGSGATATGDRNAVWGYLSMSNFSSANRMSVLGYNAAAEVTTAQRGVVIGANAADSLTSSIDAVIIGRESGQALTSENGVTLVGAGSGYLLTDTETTCVGWACLPAATTSTKTTVVGSLAGNTLVTGDQVTLLGADTDVTAGGRANCTALGYGATCAADNSVKLGNASVTTVATTGAWRGPAGTDGAPAVSSSGDPDTGFRFPGSYVVVVVDSSTQAYWDGAAFTNTGNILPSATDSYDLGSAAAAFRRGYFGTGTLAAPAVAHRTMTDAGLTWDTANDGLYFQNNTGSIVMRAESGGLFVLDSDATSYITVGGTNQSLILDPSGSIEADGLIEAHAGIQGTATTGTGPGGVFPWRHARLINDAPVKPTCDATSEGSSLYVDDSNDALAGMLCFCSADAARAVWGWLTTLGTTCPGT